MAKLSADGTYVTVEKGDNLWAIARTYLKDETKWKQLAADSRNGIKNASLIYPGQIIYLNSSGGTSTTNTATTSNVVKLGSIREQSNSDNTLFVTWEWNRDNTDFPCR